ncbi:MAG TPA: hypothetical protein DEA50_01475, partial [Parvularcula sp.]|nr:hypothetical protein [Parvularcula sp.]
AFADVGAFGEAALKAFAENAETIRIQTEETLAAARVGFDAANERLRAVNADAMSAARDEMTEAVDFANELARARSIGDALEIQRGYWTKLFDTRIDRARALSEASVEATREMFAPVNRTLGAAVSMAPAFDKFFPFAGK